MIFFSGNPDRNYFAVIGYNDLTYHDTEGWVNFITQGDPLPDYAYPAVSTGVGTFGFMMPVGLDSSQYWINIYEQLGSVPADSDLYVKTFKIHWTGLLETDIYDFLRSDFAIDTSKTPWEMVYYREGSMTDELKRVQLKAVNGANIVSTGIPVGQHLGVL